MKIVADLHVHTQASDGVYTPREVVARARRLGLDAIAITDHDTVDGITEALSAAKEQRITVFPGVELSTEYNDREIHILGFCIDHTHSKLLELLNTLHQSRFNRAEKMVQKLTGLGYEINMQEVRRQAVDAAPGRPHIARVLVEKDYFPSVSDVFSRLLGYKMPGYVERYKLTPKEAIQVIASAGGFSSWAHPGLTGDDRLLAEFIHYGLRGLETYHPDHDEEEAYHYRRLAEENDLLVSGGSDFHGQNGSHARELGFCGLTQVDYARFKEYCKSIVVKF
ncbi:PHP domain-containing protein [Dethiobacter alkaliphilus]|uniref:PHP domain-containing protein n=1 Tax=Dethiobacter alkaliphilus TaxID=427926 RepID=UPI002226802B|nr:PHP domain-containing protein [Dethiobacter alkaliphilus]MCW3490746.1 PHP domain-containing protein [Dethiobacter alkaliphilus]